MNNKTTPFILGVAGAAAVVALLVPAPASGVPESEIAAVAVLGLLALAAELLAFLMPKGMVGSIAAMPALAAMLISPSWYAIAAIAVVVGVAESVRKSEFQRA